MDKREAGGVGGIFRGLLIAVLVCGLLAVVVYLMSEINHRKYRLSPRGDVLVVERGMFLPLGFAEFVPDAPALQDAYAVVPLPPGQLVTRSEVFDDRTDMDRQLFALLAGWARQRLDDPDPDMFGLAVTYISRCELLPGLSEEQRSELRVLRGNLAYRNGHYLLREAQQRLQQALAEFRLSVALGTSRASDASEWIAEIERRIAGSQQPSTAPAPATPPASGYPALPSAPSTPSAPRPTSPPPAKKSTEGSDSPKWRL
jgi:hypothetical protein